MDLMMIKQDFQNLDDQNYSNDESIDEIADVLFEVLNVSVYFSLFHLESVRFYQLEHEMIFDIHDHPNNKEILLNHSIQNFT
jgi:hypothetical protein